MKFLPVREIADPPTILKPDIYSPFQYEDARFMVRAGIHSYTEAQRIKNRTMFPIERQAVLNAIALGMPGKEVQPTLTIVPFLNTPEAQGISNKTWAKVWGNFLVFGRASAGIMGFYILAKIVKFTLDTAIHAFALYKIYGFSFHLLGAV